MRNPYKWMNDQNAVKINAKDPEAFMKMYNQKVNKFRTECEAQEDKAVAELSESILAKQFEAIELKLNDDDIKECLLEEIKETDTEHLVKNTDVDQMTFEPMKFNANKTDEQ